MEINPSVWFEISAEKTDKKRIYGTRRDTEEAVKKKRKFLVLEKQVAEANSINNEETTYSSGSF